MVRRTARPESWRVLRDGTVQFKMRQWHGTWRWLVHEDSGSETEGMTTEVADEHSVYIESLGGRYVWDEDRSCWKWTCTSTRARPSSAPCAPDAQSTHLPLRPWPPLQRQCGLQGPGPQRDGLMALGRRECAEGGTL